MIMSTVVAIDRADKRYVFFDYTTTMDGMLVVRDDPKAAFLDIQTPSELVDRIPLGFVGNVIYQNAFVKFSPPLLFNRESYNKNTIVEMFTYKWRDHLKDLNLLTEGGDMNGKVMGISKHGVFVVSDNFTTMFIRDPYYSVGSGSKAMIPLLKYNEGLLLELPEEDLVVLMKKLYKIVSEVDIYTSAECGYISV